MRPWQIITTILLVSAICFLVGYRVGTTNAKNATVGQDTVVIRDTLRDNIPFPVVETVVQEVPELFPVYITLGGDTVWEQIYVPVPITQKEYATDDYRAWVSGYKPALDSLWVYPERVYIKEKARRWGIGVTAGYGLSKDGLSPYVGVGGFYRIW